MQRREESWNNMGESKPVNISGESILGRLKIEYKKKKPTIELKEQCGHIEKPADIPGLGKITFRLNPELYLNLDMFLKDTKKIMSFHGFLYPKTSVNSNFKINLKRVIESIAYVNKLNTKKIKEILDDNIKRIQDLLLKYKDTEEVKFLQKMFLSVPESISKPKIVLGNVDEDADATYRSDNNSIYINVDQIIRRVKRPNANQEIEASNKNLIEELAHEFFHYYDIKVLDLKGSGKFLEKQYYKIAGDHVFRDNNYVFTVADTMESIARIMESLEVGRMDYYAGKYSPRALLLLQDTRKLNKASLCEEGFKDFMLEVIPNIFSVISFKNENDYKKDFSLYLTASMYDETKETFEERKKTFDFLQDFLKEYQDVHILPKFLQKGIDTMVMAYKVAQQEIVTQQSQDKAQSSSHDADKNKNTSFLPPILPPQKVKSLSNTTEQSLDQQKTYDNEKKRKIFSKEKELEIQNQRPISIDYNNIPTIGQQVNEEVKLNTTQDKQPKPIVGQFTEKILKSNPKEKYNQI